MHHINFAKVIRAAVMTTLAAAATGYGGGCGLQDNRDEFNAGFGLIASYDHVKNSSGKQINPEKLKEWADNSVGVGAVYTELGSPSRSIPTEGGGSTLYYDYICTDETRWSLLLLVADYSDNDVVNHAKIEINKDKKVIGYTLK